MRYVDGVSGTGPYYYSPTAGKHLKASSGWNSNGNGLDTYGFSALPGGFGYPYDFLRADSVGIWLSSTEYNSNQAYYQGMDYGDSTGLFNLYKDTYSSVRCVKD